MKGVSVNLDENTLMLVTGATGLVGSHVIERAREKGIRTRVLVRASSNTGLLDEWGVEKVAGELTDAQSLTAAVADVNVIVHCAAKVGDWGPIEDYRDVNVGGLENLLSAAEATGTLKRFIHISSLGVYEARDHYGTDETEKPNAAGIDGYTLTKAESEKLVIQHCREKKLPATVLRPGFIYGPRDRTVMPRLIVKIRDGGFRFLGSGEKLVNNTFVGNLVDAVFAALEHDETIGEVFNITDGRLVSKREMIETISDLAGYEVPSRSISLPVAKFLAKVLESIWRLRGKKEAPILSNARIKFLGLNLDFCIDKAKRELNYQARVDFSDGMKQTIDWFREQGMV